jgi:hypothetical protein
VQIQQHLQAIFMIKPQHQEFYYERNQISLPELATFEFMDRMLLVVVSWINLFEQDVMGFVRFQAELS